MNSAGVKSPRSRAWSRKQKGFYKGVGEKLRSVRLGQKVTQEGLAKLVGLTRTSLTNIEKGRQKLLLHTFADLAAALRVPASELLPASQELPAKAPAE